MSDFTRDRLVLIATEPPFGVGDLAINLAAFAIALLDRVDEWEKVFGHIDKDPDTAGNKIIEARREIEAERDRLHEENKSLREANEIDLGEKAPLIFENAELKARNEMLREELREATALLSDAATEMEASGGWDGDEDLFDRIMTYLRTRERKEKEE